MRTILSDLFSSEKKDDTFIEVPSKWLGHNYSELFIDSDNKKYKVSIKTNQIESIKTYLMDDNPMKETVRYKTGTVMEITSLSDNTSYHLGLNGQTQVMFIDALKQKNHCMLQANLKYFSLPESLVDLINSSLKEPKNLMI